MWWAPCGLRTGSLLRRGSFSSFCRGGSVVIVASIAAYTPLPVRIPFSATSIPSYSLQLSTPRVTLRNLCPLLESHHQVSSHKIDGLLPQPQPRGSLATKEFSTWDPPITEMSYYLLPFMSSSKNQEGTRNEETNPFSLFSRPWALTMLVKQPCWASPRTWP